MKRTAKILLSVLMILSMAASMTACGRGNEGLTPGSTDAASNEGGGKNNSEGANTASTEGLVFENSAEEPVALGTPDTKLDPEAVYRQLTYTPEMFYGDYRLLGGEDAQEKFGEESSYKDYIDEGKECEISVLPFRIQAGKETMSHSVNFIEEHNWMELYFMKRTNGGQGRLWTVICAYTVEGNQLKLTPIDSFNVDKENNKITYKLSDTVWEYTFVFQGRTLTLTSGENSVTLTTGLNAYGKIDYFCVEHYLSENSEPAPEVDYIAFRYDAEDKKSRLYFENAEGVLSRNSTASLQENGLFTYTLALEDRTATYQYVYFYGGEDGLILTDGAHTYYYNDTYFDRYTNNINHYITEDQAAKLNDLSEAKLKEIAEKKDNLMGDLAAAFTDAGIQVTVDEKNGELKMDSSVLFEGDSAVLTSEGKSLLNKFVSAYTSIVFSEKYKDFVEKTMVEGHTAPVPGDTYEDGLPLSEERANNVKDYCLSSEVDVDTSALAAALEAVGYSNSKPVTDADGNVDMDASRRVSFRFIIRLD